ncbi:hypothetical protein [Nocardioides bruguierae]|uniref:GH26 domain-containing protein n=1 Tax=Nocardioides bruguierae TaxID=2945102 RepID=A0A9X2D6X5_9ACTN|nr:hypothetical protein [Nocardioides bruguierae]MCM0619952.1 hypothetical protein [Nocardioides bruguierae]
MNQTPPMPRLTTTSPAGTCASTTIHDRRTSTRRAPRALMLLVALGLVLTLLPAMLPPGTGAAPLARAADGQDDGSAAASQGGTALRAAAGGCRLTKILVPRCRGGVLTGAYVQPRAGESWVHAVRRFERSSGGRLGTVHLYYRGDDRFPSDVQKQALRQGGQGPRLLFANWKVDDGYTWREVAQGDADQRIRAQARYLKSAWNRKMFLTVHHEPEDEVVDTKGSGYTALAYRAMYRHVVDVFEDEGVTNVVWVMNYMGFEGWHLKPWFHQLWPGARYVDWIAYDSYMSQDLGGYDPDGLRGLLNRHWSSDWRGFYRWATHRHPHKPLMLGEWGLGERPGRPRWKGSFLRKMGNRLATAPRLKAMMYFDHDEAAIAGDVTIDTSARSLRGFRVLRRSDPVASVVPISG